MTPDPMGDAARYTANYLATSRAAMEAFATDTAAHAVVQGMAADITAAMRAGGRYLVCGNGGSAADAQHIAGELVGRLMFDHAPLAAIALTADSSVLTATGNDYGFEQVFSRQVLGLGREGDVLLGISTSGNSPNVLAAIAAARQRGMVVHGFSGGNGGAMATACDRLLLAPSAWTPIIQQVYMTAAHLVCALVERALFREKAPEV
ncbi:MAG: D-sedoheptulose 7-phosphate isomerase [Alphaproteobacteria bacterium]|nr:D-sedoheptulose 7-phosphate isomerase [Alphaproteobacteria bacterium]